MNKLTEQVLPTVRKVILDFMRGYEVPWAPDDYWWYGLQHVWSPPDFMQQGEPVRENELHRALIDLEVPRERIVKRGAIPMWNWITLHSYSGPDIIKVAVSPWRLLHI